MTQMFSGAQFCFETQGAYFTTVISWLAHSECQESRTHLWAAEPVCPGLVWLHPEHTNTAQDQPLSLSSIARVFAIPGPVAA